MAALVITGIAAPMVMVTGLLVVPVAFVAVTVIGNEPIAVGVPEIVDVPLKVTPAGNPPVTLNDVGALSAVIW